MTAQKTFIKTINPDVVSLVGTNCAMLFQHISYWMESVDKDVIFRSAVDLMSDLGNSLTQNQLYYARKKLIDAGLITVSTESENKWNKTTYYRITEKGQALRLLTKKVITKVSKINDKDDRKSDVIDDLSNVKDVKVQPQQVAPKVAVEVKQERSAWIPKHLYAQKMKDKRKDENFNKEMIVSENMKQSFNEGFRGSDNATKGIPTEALAKLPQWMQKKMNLKKEV